MTETEIALLNALENLERNRKATEQQTLSELEKLVQQLATLAEQHKVFQEQLLGFNDALQELCLRVNGLDAMQQKSIQTLTEHSETQKKQSKVLSKLKGQ